MNWKTKLRGGKYQFEQKAKETDMQATTDDYSNNADQINVSTKTNKNELHQFLFIPLVALIQEEWQMNYER